MRLLSLTILLMFGIYSSLVLAQPHNRMRSQKNEQADEQAQASLELVTRIVQQRYCKSSDSAEYNTLRLELRLGYENSGQQTLILYKGSNIAYREMVSVSPEEAGKMHYMLDLSLTVDVQGTPDLAGGAIPDKNFVILPPGATYETMASTSSILFLKGSDEANSADALGAGEYVLQVQVSTFPYPQSVENELRQRWKGSGKLWAGRIISKPMTFRIEKDRKIVSCDQ